MRYSCIRHPSSSHYVQLHKWQVNFCQGNHCAALLLSFFASWHDWKLKNDEYYHRANDIAETHGDGRPHNENAYLFFTMNDLVDALMGLFGKKSISDALELLISLQVITVHKNPNPRYHFDKTKYFRFYPEVCNEWIKNREIKSTNDEKNIQVVDKFDNAEIDNGKRKNELPSSENGRPSRKNGQAITYKTNNTTNINKSINAREAFFDQGDKNQEALHPIITALKEKGMPERRFFPEARQEIDQLRQQGASVATFTKAFDIAEKATQGRGFGISYLGKVIRDLLQQKTKEHNRNKSPPNKPKDHFSNTFYEENLTNVEKWKEKDKQNVS